MAAGLTHKLWEMANVVKLIDEYEASRKAAQRSAKRGHAPR